MKLPIEAVTHALFTMHFPCLFLATIDIIACELNLFQMSVVYAGWLLAYIRLYDHILWMSCFVFSETCY
jgi:hypothetical protein